MAEQGDCAASLPADSRLRILAQASSARWDRRRGRPPPGTDQRLQRQKEIRRRKYQPALCTSPMQRPGLWDQQRQQEQQREAAAALLGNQRARGEGDAAGEPAGKSFPFAAQWRREPKRFSVNDLPFHSSELQAEGPSDPAGDELTRALVNHFRFNRPPLLQRHSVLLDASLGRPPPRTSGKSRRLMEAARRQGGAEDDVDNDWILNHQLQEKVKRAQRQLNKLRISVPEDDGSEMIKDRLDEVRSMCKQVVRAEYFFSLLPESQQQLVLELEEMSPDDFKKSRRTHWKKIDLFRFAARMAHIISKASGSRRRYMHVGKSDSSAVSSQVSKQKELNKPSKDNKDYYLCSISKELRNSLITRPEFRTQKDIKRIIWLLRATKAFTHLFPAEMEEMCALYVGYEKYDDGRVLAYQDKPPEKFYYVIGGKINRIRQYKLTLGEVNKSLGFITKAMTTDPEEMENEISRDSFLVAKGLVEVLVLQKWAYFYLLKSTSGPPLDFLRKIDIFKEFPCELFVHSPDAIDMRYYGPSKMVVGDSNRTPWLHIVKSGFVKVVRHQQVYDNGRNKSTIMPSSHKIGEGRRTSHAGAMMGLSSRQRRHKENSFSSLPDINASHALSHILDVKRSRTTLPLIPTKTTKMVAEPLLDSDRTSTDLEMPTNGHPDIEVIVEGDENEEEGTEEEEENWQPSSAREPMPSFHSETPLLLSEGLSVPSGKKNVKILASRPKINSAPNSYQIDLNIPITVEQFGDRDFIQRAFLTRERTELSAVLSGKKRQVQFERPTYVQLDTLRPGDVFGFKDIEKFRPKERGTVGLDHLGAPLASEDIGLTLISEGAEIIRISKRFFVANAENNTMLKVETLYKDYMTEDSAKELLKDQNTWREYKSLLIGRTINDHSRRLKSQRASAGSSLNSMR